MQLYGSTVDATLFGIKRMSFKIHACVQQPGGNNGWFWQSFADSTMM